MIRRVGVSTRNEWMVILIRPSLSAKCGHSHSSSRSAAGVACGKMYSLPPIVSISTNWVIATSPICHFMRHLPFARMQVLRNQRYGVNYPARLFASTGRGSKTCPPVLTLNRPDPGMHNKVKNQRIWLMPLSFDLFKYFSDKKRQRGPIAALLPPQLGGAVLLQRSADHFWQLLNGELWG